MPEQTFEQLAADAAAGLQADREVYRDVTQELHSFLEDKAERYRREGHDDEESITLAKKAFGSPLDVASELLNANRGRLRLRAAFRIAFGALIVPLAIFLALYVGYGRVARLQAMGARLLDSSYDNTTTLPTVPLFENRDIRNLIKGDEDLLIPDQQMRNAESIRQYWEAHRGEPGSHIYYAYYTIYATTGGRNLSEVDPAVIKILRQGEQVEPDNALYNMLLAEHYLTRGMISASERQGKDVMLGDELRDRQAFELGLTELRKAAKKPYYRTYQMQIMRQKLNALPRPLLTEDYLRYLNLASHELFPQYARLRDLARKTPGCARLLAAEGRTAEAEAVMDTWQPLSRLLAEDSDTIIGALVATAVAKIVTEEGAKVYTQLGESEKAGAALAAYKRVTQLLDGGNASANSARVYQPTKRNTPASAEVLLPVFAKMASGVPPVTAHDITPLRMHEHVLIEEAAVQLLQVLFVLALLGMLMQGAIWHYRLRRAASVPLLLLPPAKEILRALWWGIVLPLAVYWLYSRLPIIGGREYSFKYMGLRFGAEMLIVGILALWIPARLIGRYVRRRCENLDIPLPPASEAPKQRKLQVAMISAIALLVINIGIPFEYLTVKMFGTVLLVGFIAAIVRYAVLIRQHYGLYYGTLARSMAPLYAFAILFLALIAQPWLLANEAYWLRKDTLVCTYLSRTDNLPKGFTSLEGKVVEAYSRRLVQVLEKQ
ncbi:MAG: permease prefix domain 1-containing protein [Armatimonadota bacterium]